MTSTSRAYFDGQPKVMSASGALFRDERGLFLLVKPSYRDVWHVPGGIVETDESPRDAARRETLEEIGLAVDMGRLLCVDFKPATTERPACLQFLFDGGVLDAEQLSAITVAPKEIEAWRLVTGDQAESLVQEDGPARRMRHTLAALADNSTVYLEDGHPH